MKDYLNINKQVCFPVYLIAKEITNLYRPLLKEIDLTYPQYLVMLILWEDKTQTVSELGKKLSLDSGTLTPLLKRMEVKELIERTRSSLDERVVNISLTEKGEAIKEKARCVPKQLIESMNVSQEDLLNLKNIIIKILKNKKNETDV